VEVPAAWLATAPELPDRCVRHGLPAVRRVDFVIKSRPKLSPWRRTLLPGYSSLDRAAEYARGEAHSGLWLAAVCTVPPRPYHRAGPGEPALLRRRRDHCRRVRPPCPGRRTDGAAVSIAEPHPEFAGQLQRLFQP